MRVTHALTAIAVSLGLALSGCGGDDAASGSDSTQFNDRDVAFAQDMIPHHQQAVMMADLAADATKDPAVAKLAREIQQAQEPEIETMQSWLVDWDAEVSHEMGHNDLAHGETGMMSQPEISRLTTASGRAFDRLFLRLMIEHHEGAIEMARTEQSGGTNDDALALAERIGSTQAAEIERMESLLAGR